MRKRGIFIKVFLYTLLFLLLAVGITAALFAQQIVDFYNSTQMQQLSNSYFQLTEQLSNAHFRDHQQIAREFAERNQSYNFIIQDQYGRVVFASIQMDNAEITGQRYTITIPIGYGFTLSALAETIDSEDYSQLFGRIIIALSILLALSILGAIIFARQMTKPIKELVVDAENMSILRPVSPPSKRNDEIGELTSIVHDMYGKLKDTIAHLEEEKESQRYFFAAASHELKTPIAATTALLQGMFDNIGEYKDHPKYLWECLKMMREQNNTITEILEIVNLTDNRIVPNYVPLRVLDVLEEVLTLHQTLIDAKEQTIGIQVPGDLECVSDNKMLNRALSNVMLNAVQNTPEQGEIHIWTEPYGSHYFRLCIRNSDSRIDEDILPRLFDPFFRVDEARTTGHGRSGLGLTIVAKTFDYMSLSYGLANVEDGVIFWVYLPL